MREIENKRKSFGVGVGGQERQMKGLSGQRSLQIINLIDNQTECERGRVRERKRER